MKKNNSGHFLFSIKYKIAICFLVPLLFMFLIGYCAYRKAAEGMKQKFQESTLQTIKMVTEYVDMSCDFIEAEGMKYAFSAELAKYYLGFFENDPIGKKNLLANTKYDIMSAQTINSFISNIYIVTKNGITMFSTKEAASMNGFFENYMESMSADGRYMDKWVDRHTLLDNHFGIKENDYILSFQALSKANNACIVIDVKQSAIKKLLEGLDIGDGSIVGFVTGNGREIVCRNTDDSQENMLPGENIFFGQEFYDTMSRETTDKNAETKPEGLMEVVFQGEKYLFLYSRSEKTAATACVLIPVAFVTNQASEIGNLTIMLGILAGILVLCVGIATVSGIQNNMKRISGKFGEVEKGDLTVEIAAKSRDEFSILAGSATQMIANTKKLVNKVRNAAAQLGKSAGNVNEASGIIEKYSKDITNAIGEINGGIARQSRHAQECAARTDALSDEFQTVGQILTTFLKLVTETDSMINSGMEIIKVLGKRAEETTDITSMVSESIRILSKENQNINAFAEIITDISKQTNLLSLNASIEAARAGVSGRGFAVVAEEIRRLAEHSSCTASEICKNVEHISTQIINSVENANRACSMVHLQSQSVGEAIAVFHEMQKHVSQLVDGLNDIIHSMENADRERTNTVNAVKNISSIIEATEASAAIVHDIADGLLKSVENLGYTAKLLGENMEELETEVSVFKT